MTAFPPNAIYRGDVYHARHRPFFHDYRYKVFTLFADLDALPDIAKTKRLFSFNRFNVLSFYERDHGPRDGSPLRPWVEEAGSKAGMDLSGHRIYFLGFPRLWGYVFNPISLYYCYAPDGALEAVLYQVKNTFGEQHSYFARLEGQEQKQAHSTGKVFHVSPFIQMDCRYHFTLKPPGEKLNLTILQDEKTATGEWEKVLTAGWNGRRTPFSDSSMAAAIARTPLMTLKVMAAIHWEALRLWRKGARYIRKPKPPEYPVSLIDRHGK